MLLLASAFLRAGVARADRSPLRVSPAAARALLAYDWPGNVRELQNAIERALALAQGDEIAVGDLPERIRESASRPAVDAGGAELVPLDAIERRHILAVVSAVGGNKKLAAQILGLDRSTLYRKLEQYGAHQPRREE